MNTVSCLREGRIHCYGHFSIITARMSQRCNHLCDMQVLHIYRQVCLDIVGFVTCALHKLTVRITLVAFTSRNLVLNSNMPATATGLDINNFLAQNSPFVLKVHEEGSRATATKVGSLAQASVEGQWRASVAVADPNLIPELNMLLNRRLEAIDTFDLDGFSIKFEDSK